MAVVDLGEKFVFAWFSVCAGAGGRWRKEGMGVVQSVCFLPFLGPALAPFSILGDIELS
jgi:hypothetical protein